MNKIATWLFALLFTFAAGVAQAADPKVEIKTNLGSIIVELYPDDAPKTVANFLQYVKEGYYKNLIFHRVIKGFMIQGGLTTKDFQPPKPTHAPIESEADNGLENLRGTIAMARSKKDINSATAQFYINHADNPKLDFSFTEPGYTVFGKVLEGMEVVDKIATIPTGAAGPFKTDVPKEPAIIEDVILLDK
ncbi:MAG: peptidylprolyl isomerase [Pseudomonadota bacterium]